MSNEDTNEKNPREVIGGNFPPLAKAISGESGDFAVVTAAYLNDEFKQYPKQVEELLDEARAFPREIEDDAMKTRVVSVIKRLRELAKTLTGLHAKEKQPYLRGGQAVDQFFFGDIDKLARRDKRANPGAADVLNTRLTAYDDRKLAEERERRRREAEAAAEAARKAQEAADKKRAEEEEAKAKAERARNPERVAEHTAAAAEKAVETSAAIVDATVTTRIAGEAQVATLARPADIMRERHEGGTLSTMGQEKYAEIFDRDALDLEKLRAYFTFEQLEQAVRKWAVATDYRQTMPGAHVGRRNKSVVR